MKSDKNCGSGHQENKNIDKASREFPGVAVNQGDCGQINPKLVKERTKTLNNNPRNNE